MDYFSKFRFEIRHILFCGWRVKGKTKRSLSLLHRSGMEIAIKYKENRYILEGYLISVKEMSVQALEKMEEELSIAKLYFDPASWGFVIVAYTELNEDVSGDEFLNTLGYLTTDLGFLADDLD